MEEKKESICKKWWFWTGISFLFLFTAGVVVQNSDKLKKELEEFKKEHGF